MYSAKKFILRASDVIALLGLGVVYVQLLRYSLSFLNRFLPELATSADKMLFTGAAALISCAILFFANTFLIKQNHAWLGASCSVMAYGYFYIIKLWPYPSQIMSVLMSGYSGFAFLAFVVLPYIIGRVLNRRKKLGGLTEPLPSN